ncbi:MAG: hypothetical protein GY780_03255, partial [bacterium]|nr:hypothetical protein [bacterium]
MRQSSHQNKSLRIITKLHTTFLFLFLTASTTLSIAATHVASPGGNTISECVSLAVAGDTIEIEAGTYHESVVIDKALALIGLDGSGNTTVSGPDTELDVITVTADDVDLSGLTLIGGRFGLTLSETITSFQLSDCVISETGNSQMQLPVSLVNSVVNAATIVPHASGELNSVRIHSGTITESTTWPVLPAGIVYFLHEITITVGGPSSPVLTLAPGTLIKNWRSNFIIGTNAGNPGGIMADNVVFTSLRDDTVGGNTSGDNNSP